MPGRLCIIGDVHGMINPLRSLVEKLGVQPADTLVFVGDLIDKGPDSAGVVAYVEDLRQRAAFEVVLVEGNHEDRMRRYLRNLRVRPAVAREQADRTPELVRLHGQLGSHSAGFLERSVPFFRCSEYDILVVHGGVPGTMKEFPNSVAAVKTLVGRDRKRFEKIYRTRFLKADTGAFLALGEQKPNDPFWAETYDGRFGHVVFGHQPFLNGPAEFQHATGIDTGAVHGGGLTALVYTRDQSRIFITAASDCHLSYEMNPVRYP